MTTAPARPPVGAAPPPATTSVALTAADPPAPRRGPRVLGRSWVTLFPLALVLGSELDLRQRAEDSALAGAVDLAVLVEIGLYALVGFLLITVFPTRRPRVRLSSVELAGALLVGVLALSALWSPFPGLALVRAAQAVVLGWLALQVAQRASRAALHGLAHAFLVLSVGLVLFGAAVPFPRTGLTADRFSWAYVHPVPAGVWLGLATTIATSYLVATRPRPGPRWPGPIYTVLLLVVLGGLFATQTRGAVAATAVAVLVVTVLGVRQRRDAVASAVLVLAVGALLLRDAVLAFVQRGEDASQLATLNSRTQLWALAGDEIGERPFLGSGLGASRGIFLDEIGLGGAHNAVVNLLVDQGLIGALAWVALVVLAVRSLGRATAQRTPGSGDAPLVAGLLAFLVVAGLTSEFAAVPATTAFTFLLLAAAWSVVARRPAAGGAASADADTAPRTRP